MSSQIINIADAFISAIENSVIVLNDDLNIITYNSSFGKMFNPEEEPIRGENYLEINNHRWNLPILEDNLEKIANGSKDDAELEFSHKFNGLGKKNVHVKIRKLELINQDPELILVSIEESSDLSQTKKMLDRSLREIQIRDKVSEIFASIPDESVYKKVLKIILELLESDIGYFGYINEDGALVCPTMTREVWEKCEVPEKDIIFPKEDWGGIWGKSLKESKSIVKNEGLKPPQGHISLENALCVPILYNGELIGQIVVGNKDSDYTEEDKKLLENIAKQISPILHARLERDRQEEQRKEMEERLKSSKQDEIVDYVDKQILNQLFKDGKMSLNRIKEHVVKKNGEHMSHTGINNRIDKLMDSDILRIQGNINLSELEYQAAIILVELRRYNLLEEYVNHAKTCPRIFLLATSTGNYHLILGMVGNNIEDINCCLNNCDLVGREEIKNSEVIFAPNLLIPNFVPINLFDNIDNHEEIKEECVGCESYMKGICSGCGK